MRNNAIFYLMILAALLTMGIAMPNCGGQAMQSQLDALNAANSKLTAQVQAMEPQVKALLADNAQLKQTLGQMTATIAAQKTALDDLSTAVKELVARKAAAPAKAPATKAPSKASAKPAAKKGSKAHH